MLPKTAKNTAVVYHKWHVCPKIRMGHRSTKSEIEPPRFTFQILISNLFLLQMKLLHPSKSKNIVAFYQIVFNVPVQIFRTWSRKFRIKWYDRPSTKITKVVSSHYGCKTIQQLNFGTKTRFIYNLRTKTVDTIFSKNDKKQKTWFMVICGTACSNVHNFSLRWYFSFPFFLLGGHINGVG